MAMLTHFFIGASLSEPHTSVTSLRACVCMLACVDRPRTGNFKYAISFACAQFKFKFKKIHGVLFFMFFNTDGSTIHLNHDGVAECEGKIAS